MRMTPFKKVACYMRLLQALAIVFGNINLCVQAEIKLQLLHALATA